MSLRALLIDDDDRLAELVVEYLGQNDVTVTHAADGGRGLAALAQGAYDVVLLDVMMPGLDGLEVCRRIRAGSSIPVIMLTARGDEADRVVGLELGADDYLPKPFSPRELLARIRAVLRRARPETQAEKLVVDDLVIDVGARSARVSGRLIDLTALEHDLLVALARRAGRPVGREALLELAGRADVAVGERTVDVHVSRLRAKLGDTVHIKTVRGVGYVLSRAGEET